LAWPYSRPIGIIIAALLAIGLRSSGFSLFPGQFWWKTAFLVELVSIPIALYIWHYVPQDLHWLSKKKDHVDIMKALGPLVRLFRGRQLVRTLRAMVLTSVGFFAFYIVWTLIPNELVSSGAITRDQKFVLAALAGLVGIPGNLSFGYISDRLRWKNARTKLFTIYCIIFAAATVLFPVAGNNLPFLAVLLCMFQFSCGGFSSFGALLGELFHTSCKATGTNVCYNIGRTFAGMMQMAAAVALLGAALGWSLLMAASVVSCVLILLDAAIMWSFSNTEGLSVDELDSIYEKENSAQEKH
jgi:predicted MFS family arabinose efflux permease